MRILLGMGVVGLGLMAVSATGRAQVPAASVQTRSAALSALFNDDVGGPAEALAGVRLVARG